MGRPTYDSFLDGVGGDRLEMTRRFLGALAMLASGQNPDGTPFHPDSGTGVALEAVPTSGGARLSDAPCHYVMLKNQTGIALKWGFAAGEPLFTIEDGFDERVNVSNANQIYVFDAGDNGRTFRAYAIA
jgi:hypothetical protein